jgi:hypothetical protein
VLKSGGTIGMTTPALDPDPYEADVPEAVWSIWAHEVAAWHTPQWWRRHWQLSGLLEDIEAGWLADGRGNWIRWAEAVQSVSGHDEGAVLDLLKAEAGARIGFVSVTARRR